MITVSPAFKTANAILQKVPIFLIEIASYPRKFVNRSTGVSDQYEWITSVDDHSITINDMDGGADLGAFSFNVQDRNGAITADFPGFVFEGKTVTVKTGFPGMSQTDFALLFTGKVDSVESANGNTEYTFTCVDNKDILSATIYGVGDDGFATDNDHRRTLVGHPLDIVADVLENELGLARTDFNANKLVTYRDGLYGGVQFSFSLDTAPAAQDFIEQQLLKPLGGYIWVNNEGQLDFNFFRRDNRAPVAGGCLICAFTDSGGNIVDSPFFVPVSLGNPQTVPVPTGATQISMGVNDPAYADNIGAWGLTINGGSVSVSGQSRPWNTSGGLNPNYSFASGGSIAPATHAVTAGTDITIAYVGGTVQIGVGFGFTDPLGNPGMGTDPSAAGVYAVSISTPVTTPDFNLHEDNIEEGTLPEASQADLIDTITFRLDKDSSGKFQTEIVRNYTPSVAKYGQYGQQIIESDGMRSSFQGSFLAAFVAQMIFLRYGSKNLKFDEVSAHWTAVILEPGDLVSLSSPHVPDRTLGVMGMSGKLFEVLDRKWDFNNCVVTLKLLDASYLLQIGEYLIAPDGVPAFPSASSEQKGRYMFMSNDSDQYSDGTAGHPLG